MKVFPSRLRSCSADDLLESLVVADLEFFGKDVAMLLGGECDFIQMLHTPMGGADPTDRAVVAVEPKDHFALAQCQR